MFDSSARFVGLILFCFILQPLTACAQHPIAERIQQRMAERRAAPAPSYTSSAIEQTINVDGDTRSYRIYVPKKSSSTGKYALLFNFHGFGSNAREQEKVSNMQALADKNHTVIVYPQGLTLPNDKPYWRTQAKQDRQAELRFVHAMLDELQQTHPINPKRIYATGISNGGGMANMVAAEMSDVFAAIAPVAGAYYDHTDYQPAEPVAVMAFHGTADRTVPIHGRAKLPNIEAWAQSWSVINGCASTPRVVQNNDQLTWKRWRRCQAAVNVVAIKGEGHSWPGSIYSRRTQTDVNASEMMFDFFQRHPKRH